MGGAHILTPLQRLYQEYCSNSGVLRDRLHHVYCEEIMHECPLDIGEIIGWDHNAFQHFVTKPRMGEVALRMWTRIQKCMPKEMLLVAMRKPGRLGQKTTTRCNTQRTKKTSGRHRTSPPMPMSADSLCTSCRTLRRTIGDPRRPFCSCRTGTWPSALTSSNGLPEKLSSPL